MSHRSRKRFIVFVALTVGTTLSTASASSAPPAGQLHAKLQIKPGLWEFNDNPKIVGDTVFPDAVLNGVPEAQRSQHLAELRQMLSRPSRERECLTQAVFEQRLSGIGTGCTRTVVSNTSSRLEISTQCHGAVGALTQSTTTHILATSATSATTLFHAVSTRAGHTMTTNSVERGRWIGSNCGNVHGIQLL